MEVALRIHESDADERHAEVAGFLAVIAGQHAEAARVDRQRLVQRELGREVRDRLAASCGKRARPPGVVGGARLVQRLDGAIVMLAEIPDPLPRLSSLFARDRSTASGQGCGPSRARAGSRAAERRRALPGASSTRDRPRAHRVGEMRSEGRQAGIRFICIDD